ncbi:MAG: PepSY-like domain-containing protein [Tannerellaceae bacterium]|jgi:hypothetical protein|nr:PepSY-like domain-containing protein [Tannerellaceae bacterium]
MKFYFYVRLCAAGLALLLFVNCSESTNTTEESEGFVPGEQIMRSFEARYPQATGVVWSVEEGYYVADFTLNSQTASAWFASNGELSLGKIPASYSEQVEPVVSGALASTAYAKWVVKGAYVLDRRLLTPVYGVNMTNNHISSNLYFTQNGDFIKVIDDVHHRTDVPVVIPSALIRAIDNLFTGIEIVDVSVIDAVNSEISVGILREETYLTAIFNKNYVWIVNFWNLTPETVPQNVWNGFKASPYADLQLSRIRSMQNATTTTYLFYLIRNNKTMIAEFNSDGRLTTIISREHVMAKYLLTI